MILTTIPVTPFQQNCRFLIDEEAKAAHVIDPGGETEKLLGFVRSEGLILKSIFLTHAHLDHAGGVAGMLRGFGEADAPKLYAHEIEKQMRSLVAKQAMLYGLPEGEFEDCPEPDVLVEDEEMVSLGGIEAKALFTPGHSPGHLSLYFEEFSGELDGQSYQGPLLIAGDTLFSGSIGRTDLPGGDHGTLISSIREKILTLPSNTLVLPGHGPNTTVGEEARSNPFLT